MWIVSSVAAPHECRKSENKQECTEPERERINDDLMEVNDA